jgi:hypothetical protein
MIGLEKRLNVIKNTITTINLSLSQKDKELSSNTLTPLDITRITGELTATDTRLEDIGKELKTESSLLEKLKYALNRELGNLSELFKKVNGGHSETEKMLEIIKEKAINYRGNVIPLDLNTTPTTTQDWTLPVDPRSGWITGDIQSSDYHNQTNFKTNTPRNAHEKYYPNAYYPTLFARYAICKPPDYNQRNPQGLFNTDRTTLYDICEWRNSNDNEVVVFHGTHLKKLREYFGGRRINSNLNSIAENHGHLLGQGFYVTFNPNEALGYVKDRPPWGSTPVPAGMYTPAIYEIVLKNARQFFRGANESRHPEFHPRQGLINDSLEVFQFIQNNKREAAKEQIAIIHEANDFFRASINKSKIHVHTYSDGTTVKAGNHDQSNDSWGPSPGNQNIPYLRDPGYRNKNTYPL